MLSNSFFSESLKQVESIVKSKMGVFHLERTSGDEDDAATSMSQLINVAKTLHKLACHNSFNVEQKDARYYTSAKSRPDAEFSTLAPMVFSGYSPFMFYEEGGDVKGLLVKIRKHRFVEDRSELKAMVSEYQKKSFREHNYISKKDAERAIEQNHDFDFPLIEKKSESFLYIDVERRNIYVSKSHREIDTVMVLFGCLRAIIELTEKDESIDVSWPNSDVLFGARNVGAMYTHYASSSENRRAGGLYNIQKMIDFYAHDDGEQALAEPTESATVFENNDPSINIAFKKALNLVTKENKDSGFKRLFTFSQEYGVTFSNLGLSMDIPLPSFVKDFIEIRPETELFSAEQTHMECVFTTEDKHGNITFKLSRGIPEISTALKAIYVESTDGVTTKDMEINLLAHLGKMLWFLNAAASSFIELYERSSPPEEGEDSFTDALMKDNLAENESDAA